MAEIIALENKVPCMKVKDTPGPIFNKHAYR